MKLRAWVVILTLLSGIGCAKKASAPHPGAISNLDSFSYDVLLTEQAVLNQAKAELQAQTIPASTKPFLNAAINQYNVAEEAWQGYHASQQGADKLQLAINALITAVAALQKEIGRPAPGPISSTTTTGEWIWSYRLSYMTYHYAGEKNQTYITVTEWLPGPVSMVRSIGGVA
jgi:hypothetical protein